MAVVSIGDFISLITLTTTVFQALSSTRGSKVEFQTLLSTLRGLSQAMFQAEALCVEYYTSAEYANGGGWNHGHGDWYEHDNSDTEDNVTLAKEEAKRKEIEILVQKIKDERDECEDLIRKFMNNLKGYRESFGDRGAKVLGRGNTKAGDTDAREWGKRDEDVWTEDGWNGNSEKQLSKLSRGKIRELGSSRVGKLKEGYKSLMWLNRQGDITTLEKRLTLHLQAILLLLVSFCHTTMKSDMVGHTHLLQNMNHSVDTLTAGVGEVQLLMSEALSKLDVVWKYVPQAMGYCWGPEAPILLLDGLGRKMSLPMLLIRTPDVFRDILLIMHKETPGYDKIKDGKYVVSDEDASGALVLRDKWQESIKPGKRIGLSFVLKHPGTSDEKQCPRCRSIHTHWSDHPGQRRCLNCYLTYEVEDCERSRLYWTDRKKRPILPPTWRSEPSVSTAKKKEHPTQPLSRSRTLDERDFPHPYQRVHYQRDILRRKVVEKPWEKADPELDEFLNALPPLHRAAATGDVEKLDEILGSGECDHMDWKISSTSLFRHDRTGWDFTGAPPIHFAAYYGHIPAVLYLLQYGVDIDGKDAAGTTALHAAAWTGNEKLFHLLLKKNADASICDYDSWSAAVYAMSQGHEGILRMALENSAEESGNDVETLVNSYKIRHASKLGNTDTVVQMLEDQAASINADITELFLGEALGGAAEGGHEELVRELLERGADPARIDSFGSTALHWAAWGGHTEIGNILYDEKIDNANSQKDEATHLSTNSSLSIIEDAPSSLRHENCMRMLLERGADVNGQNVQGCTALHWVAGAGSPPMIRFLMTMGANAEIEDHMGRTPIDRAIETGDKGALEMLKG